MWIENLKHSNNLSNWSEINWNKSYSYYDFSIDFGNNFNKILKIKVFFCIVSISGFNGNLSVDLIATKKHTNYFFIMNP